MKIALSADHRGREAVRHVALRLEQIGHVVELVGLGEGMTDYPDQADAVGSRVASGQADMGVLICGSGIGMSIAANKVRGVRAALVHDELTAQMSRSHNDANVLCLSADLLGQRIIDKIVETWLTTPFEGGRHQRRIDKISAIESGRPLTETPNSV